MNALIMALVVWLMMKEMSFDGDYMVANITAYLIAQIHNFFALLLPWLTPHSFYFLSYW